VNRQTRQMATRRGITLIEVLFSIGIVTIGVFGIMAMLMLAGLRAKESVDANQAAALGRQALAEIPVRGWQRDDMVLFADPTNAWRTLATVKQTDAIFQQIFLDGRISYCLDPHLVANSATFGFSAPESRFPYSGSGRNVPALTMPRATVARTVTRPPVLPVPISAPMADRFMSLNSQLAFDRPDDRTLLPVQLYDTVGTSPPLRRTNDGDFSWMATVTPGIDRSTVDRRVGDTYVLSVVVFRQRVPYRVTPAPQNQPVNGERQVLVSAFSGTGLGGGTVQIAAPSSMSFQQAEVELKLRRGQWVLLSGIYAGNPQVAAHAWYRVMGVDRIQGGGTNPWTRWITLEGSDWPLLVPGSGNLAGIPLQNTRLTIVENVVNVTSKTVKVEPELP